MTKNWALAAALLSLAVSISCSSARSPVGPAVSVQATGNVAVLYVGQANVQITATVSNTNNKGVAWSLTDQNGAPCNDPATCGTLSSTSSNPVNYTAPGSPASVTVVATSQADTRATGSLPLTIQNIQVFVTPTSSQSVPVNVGTGLQQELEAVAVPDDAPQTFTWPVPACGTITPDPNNSALAVFKAPNSTCSQFQIPPPASIDLNQCSDPVNHPCQPAIVNVISSRLPAGTYAFRYTGFDIGGAIAVTGQFVSNGNGTIQGGTQEDELSGSHAVCAIQNTSSYSFSSNQQGTITLNALCGGSATKSTYDMVLDATGDIQMIEDTSGDTTNRHGSGVIEPVPSPSTLNTAALKGSFAFGFTGVNLSGKRVGFVGVVTLDGSGNITGGTMDTNDNGTAAGPLAISSCSPNCYSMSNGVGSMTINVSGGQSYSFELYGVSGQSKRTDPLLIYAISTAVGPALSGTMTFQDPNPSYDLTTFRGTNVAVLSGVSTSGTDSNVALSTVFMDGKSGSLSGSFDQNNGGTLVPSTIDTNNPGQFFSNGYSYSNTGCAACGRYTINLLGNPTANPPAPMQFVMYASAANRGYLLDQSSDSVMTGTIAPQTSPAGGSFAASEMPSPFAAATQGSPTSAVEPVVDNLLLTWVNPTQGLTGTQTVRSGSQALTGSYTDTSDGIGTFTLTAPGSQTYVFYQLDLTHFWMLEMDTTKDPSAIYAQQ